MIQHIYIKNFKAFEKRTILLKKHNLVIGENDAGKSTILQALDIFFNQEKIEKCYVRNLNEDVEIGIYYNGKFFKKKYTGASFKEQVEVGDMQELAEIKYIYIPITNYDPKQIINQLALAKTLTNTPTELTEQLKAILTSSINEVIGGIDNDLLVINHDETSIIGEQNFKYDSAIKFNVSSNGVPIESRGSGFQKNLMYALLVGNEYNNVILGVDEIENSFSINNTGNIISELTSKIGQTIVTTHSKKMLELASFNEVIPLLSNSNKTLADLLTALDSTDNKMYLLVEGKFDVLWFKYILKLLEKSNEYILLPGGGSNIHSLKDELELLGKKCFCITDGDTQDDVSLNKECIELYIPLDNLNQLLNLTLEEVPQNKENFFEVTRIVNERNDDSVKAIIANNVNNFLTTDNSLVIEVKEILENLN